MSREAYLVRAQQLADAYALEKLPGVIRPSPRLEDITRRVRLSLLLKPLPVATGDVEADAKALLAWADDRARNAVNGIIDELTEGRTPRSAVGLDFDSPLISGRLR
jgi:hypothetical protein